MRNLRKKRWKTTIDPVVETNKRGLPSSLHLDTYSDYVVGCGFTEDPWCEIPYREFYAFRVDDWLISYRETNDLRIEYSSRMVNAYQSFQTAAEELLEWKIRIRGNPGHYDEIPEELELTRFEATLPHIDGLSIRWEEKESYSVGSMAIREVVNVQRSI